MAHPRDDLEACTTLLRGAIKAAATLENPAAILARMSGFAVPQFRMLNGAEDCFRDQEVARVVSSYIYGPQAELRIVMKEDYPFRARFLKVAAGWRLVSLVGGCPACFGEGVLALIDSPVATCIICGGTGFEIPHVDEFG